MQSSLLTCLPHPPPLLEFWAKNPEIANKSRQSICNSDEWLNVFVFVITEIFQFLRCVCVGKSEEDRGWTRRRGLINSIAPFSPLTDINRDHSKRYRERSIPLPSTTISRYNSTPLPIRFISRYRSAPLPSSPLPHDYDYDRSGNVTVQWSNIYLRVGRQPELCVHSHQRAGN